MCHRNKGAFYARLIIEISCCWQAPSGPHGDRPLYSALSASCQRGSPQKKKEKKKKSCRSPSDSGESLTMQPGTMCWIGSLYISLPFGHSNATLPYEGTSTRSTCSKQNAIGDQLRRPPLPQPPPLLGLFFRQTLSLTREGGCCSINCSTRVQTIKQLVGNCDLLQAGAGRSKLATGGSVKPGNYSSE